MNNQKNCSLSYSSPFLLCSGNRKSGMSGNSCHITSQQAAYAEGVKHQSPGSAAKPRHPGSKGKPSMNTLKGFYNAGVVKPRWGLKNGWLVNPGCAARPRALMFNAFGVAPKRIGSLRATSTLFAAISIARTRISGFNMALR